MRKRHFVELTDEEQSTCVESIRCCRGGFERVRRAQILLKADVNGPGWTDSKIAEAFDCKSQIVEKVRKRQVMEGFERTLDRQPSSNPRPALLNGEQEAKLIALRLGSPPEGHGGWTLRLLARRAVELGIVESISHVTVGKTLKKTVSRGAAFSTG